MPQQPEIIPKDLEDLVLRHSGFLSKIIEDEKDLYDRIKKDGLEKQFDRVMTGLEKFDAAKASKQELMDYLRTKKRQTSLIIALADISERWDLKKTTNALSELADLAVNKTLDYLIAEKVRSKALKSTKREKCGIFILAVGKLGGGELNYSSDIDLIVLYDGENQNYIGKTTIKQFYINLTQELVEILQKFTSEGYVFRVDLRLRPDPYSTPIAISTKSAETYYENVGQNWERAAMIKSRFIAGDEKLANSYLKFLNSFVWRKYLDFEAINDIHSIKRQIDSQHNYKPENLRGHNIKVGKGGIREIEFFAQVQQLIWGGREEDLRSNETCITLRTLAARERFAKKHAEQLIEIYEFYRKIEHRLQMINDEATHSLPEEDEEFENFTHFMGFKNSKEFEKELSEKLAIVQKFYADLFVESPSLGAGGNLVFTGVSDDPETLLTLAKMGFVNPERTCSFLRGWHHGRRRATRTKRVREILTEITPDLLESFAESTNPDVAFSKFDSFLAELPSGMQIFNLFNDRPELIKLCAEIMGNSPWLAENFSRSPNLAVKILRSDFKSKLPDLKTIHKRLEKNLDDLEDSDKRLKVIRRWKHDMEFQVGIRLLKNYIDHEAALTRISEIAVIVVENVLLEAAKISGAPDEEISIVAMGRLGEKQLTFGSDLDLVFIYEPINSNSEIRCKKIAQKFTQIMTVISEDGRLYPVDTRLRPSGDQGAIASSLTKFEKYYNEAAWSWEFMALTKAQPVAGDKNLCDKLETLIASFLMRKRDKAGLAKDMFDMRAKVAKQFSKNNIWDIKHATGGLFEIEFIIQYFKLTESHAHPEILKYNQEKFWQLLKTNSVLPNKVADELKQSFVILRDMQSIIRLISQTGFDSLTASRNQKNLIVKNMNMKNFNEVESLIASTQTIVHNHFNKIFNQ